MYILGFNAYGHDTSFSLLKDGLPVMVIEEERLTRVKHTKEFPLKSLHFCLDSQGLTIDDIDHIGYYFNPYLTAVNLARYLVEYFPRSLRFMGGDRLNIGGSIFGLPKKIESIFGLSRGNFKFHYIKHHEAHAASAFFPSQFERAAVLSIDGWGEFTSTWLGVGSGLKMKPLKVFRFPHSIGCVYTSVTEYLGFRMMNGEGKVMGLAPYGKPRYLDKFREIIALKSEGRIAVDTSYFSYYYKNWTRHDWISQKFIDTFGPKRVPESELTQDHCDIAASLQAACEEAAVHIANHLYEITKEPKLCYAGGFALNSVANNKILERTPFKEIFIQPSAGDAGTSLGCTLKIYNGILRQPRKFVQETAYLGPEYSNEEIETELKGNQRITYEKRADLATLTARLISEGKIIGWFQGRMECGPRALGNRSILADPRNPGMKDILNSKVKHREGFRPFAPVVLEEKVSQYFDGADFSPFMLLVMPVKKSKRKVIPAITHVDGTARVQTVNEKQNAGFYGLIKEFEKITGEPVAINTSFNVRGEPIVCSPKDALHCFLHTGYRLSGDWRFPGQQKRSIMRVLLIYPPRLHIVRPSLPKVAEEDQGAKPPLGLLYIAAYLLRNTDHEILILDTQAEKLTYSDIEKRIAEINPDIIGISVVTYMLYDSLRVAEIAKKVNPKIHVNLGGPHLSIYPDETLALEPVDSVTVGDGEVSFTALVEDLAKGGAGDNIPGVFTRNYGRPIDFSPAFFIRELDELPFPARDLLPQELYTSVFTSGTLGSTIITSRGCPNRCIFCQLSRNKLRLRSPQNVVDEIELCLKAGISEIDIYDDTFNISVERVVEFCEEILKRGLKFSWSFRARVNKVSRPMLDLAKKAGCIRIQYGVESGSSKIIDIMNKRITLEQVSTAFKLTREAGITTFAYFMLGSPGETRSEIEETIRFSRALKPDFVSYSVTTPWPGTEMYRMGLEKGLYEKDYWLEFAKAPEPDYSPRFWDENFSPAELFQIQERALRGFYFRPAYLVKSVVKLRSWSEFKSKARAGLSLLKEIMLPHKSR